MLEKVYSPCTKKSDSLEPLFEDAVFTTLLKEAIIVVHLQLRFNLIHGI